MTPRHFVLMFGTLLAVAGPLPRAAAEDKKSWVGESVMHTKPAKQIKFGDRLDDKQVEFAFTGRLPIRVREDRDGWLRIHDGHNEGWAAKGDFVLADDAPAYFHRRVQADPGDAWALQMRGEGWHRKGEYANAIADFDECVRRDPTNSNAFSSRGNSRKMTGDYDRATEDFSEAVRLNPKYALAFVNRGNVSFAKKDYDRAIDDYDEAARLDPKTALIFNFRGNAYSVKKDYERAIKDYDEAVRLDANNTPALYFRGEAYSAKKDYDRAVRDYDEAIRLDPKFAYTFFSRSVAQMVTRRPGAVQGFQAVIELQGYKGDRSGYAVILGHLAAGQAGDEAAAKRFLADSAGKLDAAWPERRCGSCAATSTSQGC